MENISKIEEFAQKLREAANNGTLEENNSAFRMEAVDLGLSDEQLSTMIADARRRAVNDKDTRSFMKKYKYPILILLAAFIILELFLPISIGWKLILIFITLVLEIILLSVTIVKRRY
jgi:type III secretory pathway component EscR